MSDDKAVESTVAEKVKEKILENQGINDMRPDKIIKHEIVFSDEGKKDSSDNSKEILEQMALTAFQAEKDKLISEHENLTDEIESVNTPTELESLKKLVGRVSAKKGIPTGKVHSQKPTDNRGDSLRTRAFPDHQSMINALVSCREKAKLESQKAKPDDRVLSEGLLASQMIEELWKASYEGGHFTASNRRQVFQEDPSEVNPNYIKDPKNIKLKRGW